MVIYCSAFTEPCFFILHKLKYLFPNMENTRLAILTIETVKVIANKIADFTTLKLYMTEEIMQPFLNQQTLVANIFCFFHLIINLEN